MLRKSVPVGTKVFHQLYGMGEFKGWWLERPEYARVEYLLDNCLGNLLIPRKDLAEVKRQTLKKKR